MFLASMIRSSSLTAALTAALLVLTSCGGGGGGGDAPPVSSSPAEPPAQPPVEAEDDVARRAVLKDLGDKVIVPAMRALADQSTEQAESIAALANAPDDDSLRAAAQQSWKTTMVAVQRTELMQIGPSAFVTESAGQGLRLKIYPYPQFDACAIHTAAYADETIDDNTALGRTGMAALEYLLFSDNDDPTCPPGENIDGQAKRAAYANQVAARIASVAGQLRLAWDPGEGNFVQQLETAGTGSTAYASPQIAMDALSYALFYMEKQGKDRKLAAPTGIGATDLPGCRPTPGSANTGCPTLTESKFSRVSANNVRVNLETFRDFFTGRDGGLSLNDLLDGVGQDNLRERFMTMISQALEAQATLPDDLTTAVSNLPDRNACIQASLSRAGEPSICSFHGLVDQVTDTFRTEIVSTLNIRVPDYAAGDND